MSVFPILYRAGRRVVVGGEGTLPAELIPDLSSRYAALDEAGQIPANAVPISPMTTGGLSLDALAKAAAGGVVPHLDLSSPDLLGDLVVALELLGLITVSS